MMTNNFDIKRDALILMRFNPDDLISLISDDLNDSVADLSEAAQKLVDRASSSASNLKLLNDISERLNLANESLHAISSSPINEFKNLEVLSALPIQADIENMLVTNPSIGNLTISDIVHAFGDAKNNETSFSQKIASMQSSIRSLNLKISQLQEALNSSNSLNYQLSNDNQKLNTAINELNDQISELSSRNKHLDSFVVSVDEEIKDGLSIRQLFSTRNFTGVGLCNVAFPLFERVNKPSKVKKIKGNGYEAILNSISTIDLDNSKILFVKSVDDPAILLFRDYDHVVMIYDSLSVDHGAQFSMDELIYVGQGVDFNVGFFVDTYPDHVPDINWSTSVIRGYINVVTSVDDAFNTLISNKDYSGNSDFTYFINTIDNSIYYSAEFIKRSRYNIPQIVPSAEEMIFPRLPVKKKEDRDIDIIDKLRRAEYIGIQASVNYFSSSILNIKNIVIDENNDPSFIPGFYTNHSDDTIINTAFVMGVLSE